MAKEFLVKGAICMCKFGATPGKLAILDQSFFKVNGGKLAGTTLSLGNTFDPPGFGVCKVNPLFPKPCVPAITQWAKPFTAIKTSAGGNPLTEESTATCAGGGPDCISVVQTGQIPVPGITDYQKASSEYQADLDPTGEPAALTKHQIPFDLVGKTVNKSSKPQLSSINWGWPYNEMFQRVDNIENKNYVGLKINTINAKAGDPIKVFYWEFMANGNTNSLQTSGNVDSSGSLYIPNVVHFNTNIVKCEIEKVEIAGETFNDTSVKKAVIVDTSKENIVIIGTQQHNSSGIKNLLRWEVAENSKLMFVHQGIREVYRNRNNPCTVLFCEEGYSAAQISTIEQTFKNIKDDKGNNAVLKFIKIANPHQIINYLNKGNINGEKSQTRIFLKVNIVSIFSHGIIKSILPWMEQWLNGDDLGIAEAKKIAPTSFYRNAKFYSYACRTGLGNSAIDKSVYVNGKDGEKYDLMRNDSLAQQIANNAKIQVYAYYKRTWYGDTLFNSDEYDFRDACNARISGTEPEREQTIYKRIIDNGMTKDDLLRYLELNKVFLAQKMIDGATFLSTGARHPVTNGKEPVGVSNGLQNFNPSC